MFKLLQWLYHGGPHYTCVFPQRHFELFKGISSHHNLILKVNLNLPDIVFFFSQAILPFLSQIMETVHIIGKPMGFHEISLTIHEQKVMQ